MTKNHSLDLICILEDKVQMLIKKHIELDRMCTSLDEQNRKLREKVAELRDRIELVEKEKTIQALHAITDEQQKEQLKRYLDMLIKNLDDNIKLLK